MSLVVDASVLVKTLVDEDASNLAFEQIADWRRIAPELLSLEVASALAKKVRLVGLSSDVAIRVLDELPRVIGEFVEDATFVAAAFALSIEIGHSIFDCMYLALALERDCRLITDDRGLLAAVRRSQYADRIVALR